MACDVSTMSCVCSLYTNTQHTGFRYDAKCNITAICTCDISQISNITIHTFTILHQTYNSDAYQHRCRHANILCRLHHLGPQILLLLVLLLLIEHICPGTTQINDLGTAITITLQLWTFPAVVCVWYSWRAADDAAPLECTVVTLVTDPDDRGGTDITVAYHTLAIALLAQPSYGYAWLLTTHDEIRIVTRHDNVIRKIQDTRAYTASPWAWSSNIAWCTSSASPILATNIYIENEYACRNEGQG